MNNAKFPLDSTAVRQAIGYSIDRDAIVKALFGDLGVNKAWQSLNPPISAKYADITAWSRLHAAAGQGHEPHDRRRLEEERRPASGPRTARPRRSRSSTTAGNKQRELIEQVMQKQLGDERVQALDQEQERRRPLRHDPRRRDLPAHDLRIERHERQPGSVHRSSARRTSRRRRTTRPGTTCRG